MKLLVCCFLMSCKGFDRYFEVMYLAKFVEILVEDSKFLDILEIGFT